MPANFTTVTGTKIQDIGGTLLAAGRIYFKPVDINGNPVSFRVGGGGQVISRAKSVVVTAGAFSIDLADVSLTNPAFVGYRVTVKDTATGEMVLGYKPDRATGYEFFQPTGATYDFDTFVPNFISGPSTLMPGPSGAPGTPGAAGGDGYVNTNVDAAIPFGNSAGSGASANAALTAAIAAYAGQTLVVPNGVVHHITADLFIPNAVQIGGTGGFYVDAGKVLTLFQPTIRLHQAFFGPGTVTVFGCDPNAEWYGATGDGATNDAPAIQRCLDQNPGRTTLLSMRRVTSAGITPHDYACSTQLTLSGRGTGLKGACAGGMPRFTGGSVRVKWPSNVAGVRMDDTNTCGYLGYLQLWGGDAFDRTIQSTYEDFPNEASLQGNAGLDGVQVLGGEQTIEHVMSYAWKRHAFYINGSSPGQPDACRYMGLYANASRGYGIYIHGVDANISTYMACNLWFNAMGGIKDGAQYGNTHIAPHSSGNASFAAIAAGANKNISSIVVDGAGVATITTSAAHGWTPGQWITTVPTDGTFASTAKLLTASGSTATYNLAAKTGLSTGAGGTAATSSNVQILAYYQSTASLLVGAYVTPPGTIGAWITPYVESNQLPALLNDSTVWNPQGLGPTSGNQITGSVNAGMFARSTFFTFRPPVITGCFQISDPAFTYDSWSFSADGLLKFKGAANNPRAAIGAWRVNSAFSMYARNNANTADIRLIEKDAADVVSVGSDAGVKLASTANGATWLHGSISELITLSTSGTTTDSVANLLPANAIIEAVCCRVNTLIATATDYKLGDATTAGRFTAASSSLTVGQTLVGTVHADQTGAAGPRQTAAAKLRITTTGTPSAGAVRVTVFYRQFVAPTS
jgi:hypothetical protein